MKKVSKIWDAADGSATPGRVFTASIPQESIANEGQVLSFLKMGVKGAVSTAAVVIETFAGLIAPFTLRYGSENRIVLNLDELVALHAFIYGTDVAIGENTDNTGNDFLGNIKIPVYEKADATKQFLVQADRAAQTNIATETVSLTGYWDDSTPGNKPIHAVRVAHTTTGTAGLETLGSQIVPVGMLKGLIVKVPNGFADGNIDTSIQRVKILSNGSVVAEWNDLGDAMPLAEVDYVTPSPRADLLRQFRIFELPAPGLDAKAAQLTLQFDVQDISDAVVMIPVLEIA